MKNKIVKIIVSSISILFMGLAFLFAFAVIQSAAQKTPPTLFNKSIFIIKTQSMEPSIKAGDVVIIDKVNVDNIKVGDVITFKMTINGIPINNTHRVIEVKDNSFITHGDNAIEGINETVLKTDVIGRYSGFRIAYIGTFILSISEFFMKNPWVFYTIVILIGASFVGIELKDYMKTYMEERKQEQNAKK